MTQTSSANAAAAPKKASGGDFFTRAMIHNGVSNVKENIRLLIVIFVLHLAAAPLMLVSYMTELVKNGADDLDSGFLGVAACATLLAAASGMVCALVVFRYLFSKSSVDMRIGLPMTASQRFVSDFLSGLFIYIVPYIAAEIITWILMLIGHLTFDGRTFEKIQVLDGTGRSMTVSWECHLFAEFAPILWRGMLGGLLLMIMFYIITVITASCCGSIFECAAYNILINIMAPVTLYALTYTASNSAAGINLGYFLKRSLTVFGPFGGAFTLSEIIGKMFYVDEFRTIAFEGVMSYGSWLISFTAATVILGIVSFLIYRARKAEDTGTPVVFGLYYHLIMTLIAFSLIFSFDFDENVPCIVITAIIYFVMSAVRNRGLAHIGRNMIICALTVAAAVGLKLAVTETECFGADRYVPDPANVKEVTISYSGLLYSDVSFYNYPAEITDPEMIRIITEAHKELVNEYADYQGKRVYTSAAAARLSNGRFGGFTLKYTLKSGREIYRKYPYTPAGTLAVLSKLDSFAGMRELRAENIRDSVKKVNFYLDEAEKNDRYFRRADQYVLYSPQWQYRKGAESFDGSYSAAYGDLPADFIDRLAECMYNDVLNESEEDYFTPSGSMSKLTVFSRGVFYVKDNYTNTIAYLASCGLDRAPVLDPAAAEMFVTDINSLGMTSSGLAEYITGEHVIVTPFTSPNTDNGIYYKNGILSMARFSNTPVYYDDIYELLCHSYKEYKSDENCYTICVDGNYAVIPAEYGELAERVFIRMTADCAAELDANSFYSTETFDSSYSGYSIYLAKFIEYYGRDRIVSALESYYESDIAAALYDKLAEIAASDTDLYGYFSEDTPNGGMIVRREHIVGVTVG